jgi:hypothetical protein
MSYPYQRLNTALQRRYELEAMARKGRAVSAFLAGVERAREEADDVIQAMPAMAGRRSGAKQN